MNDKLANLIFNLGKLELYKMSLEVESQATSKNMKDIREEIIKLQKEEEKVKQEEERMWVENKNKNKLKKNL